MSSPIRIWLEISHHAVFRVGGWAWVRADGVSVSGHAGGDRRSDTERAALSGLVAAIGQAPGPQPTLLHTSSDLVAAIPRRIKAAQAGEDPPADNLDLWAKAMTLLATAPVTIVRSPPTPGGPAAFAAAWAEFALGKAKGKGAFTAPIPKSNLTKLAVETAGTP